MNSTWQETVPPPSPPRHGEERTVLIGFSIPLPTLPAFCGSLKGALPHWVRFSVMQLALDLASSSQRPAILELSLSPSMTGKNAKNDTRLMLRNLRPYFKRFGILPNRAWSETRTWDDTGCHVELAEIAL